MIDLTLIKSFLHRSNLSLLDMDNHGSALISELQSTFGIVAHENPDTPEVNNFDAFEFAWNRLAKGDRFNLLSLAYRENNALFQSLKMDSPVKWSDFSLAQQVVIHNAAAAALVASATLFCDQHFAHDFVKGRNAVIASMQAKRDAEVIEKVRAV